jgi:hypothetical protein
VTAKRIDFGNTLSEAAFVPITLAFEQWREVKVIPGLNEITKQKLFGALAEGVQLTAKRFGLSPSDVQSILPWSEMIAHLDKIESARIDAHATFERYSLAVGGLLTGLAGATIEVDPRRKSAAQALMNVSRRFSRERDLVAPLKQLSAELEIWEEGIEKAADIINKSNLVRKVLQRRLLLRISLGFLIFAVVLVAFAFQIRERRIANARLRVAARIAGIKDPCTPIELSDEEQRHALPEHFNAIDEKKKVCEEKRAKEQYLTSCDALAKNFEAGKLTPEDEATAKASAARLVRAASGKLQADDLLAKPGDMPCGDTKVKDRLWLTYVRAAVRSTDAWGETPVISDDLRKTLATKEFENESGYKQNIGKEAEAAASKAMGTGSAERVEQAKKSCQARVDWKLEIGKKCERFLALQESLAKGVPVPTSNK